MTSNPLPPAPRRPGTVGPAAGPEVAIMDEAGRRLPAGAIGEVVIRGPNVTPGYHANPAANEQAFAHGWFHTGDQGMLDGEGYLTITGLLGARLAAGGNEVTLIARGATLAALSERGLTLRSGGEELTVRPRVVEDAAAAGPQDAVILTVKAPALAGLAPTLQPLLGADT